MTEVIVLDGVKLVEMSEETGSTFRLDFEQPNLKIPFDYAERKDGGYELRYHDGELTAYIEASDLDSELYGALKMMAYYNGKQP
jgi:hypothetical protein